MQMRNMQHSAALDAREEFIQVFVTREVSRQANKNGVSDADLIEAVRRAEDGLIDANLGAHLIKQRVARSGGGRRGGFRTLLFFKEGERSVFLHMFGKNEKANISEDEKEALRLMAKELASLGNEEFAELVERRQWKEIAYDPEEGVPK